MQLNDILHLTAFLHALPQLDESLPPEIQTQLNQIAETLKTDPTTINLDIIAENYPTLDKAYQTELTKLKKRIYRHSTSHSGHPRVNRVREKQPCQLNSTAKYSQRSPN